MFTPEEEIHKYIQELVEGKKDPIGAMEYDAPIAVLNEQPNHYLITLNSCFTSYESTN